MLNRMREDEDEGGPLVKNDRSPGRESTQRLCTCSSYIPLLFFLANELNMFSKEIKIRSGPCPSAQISPHNGEIGGKSLSVQVGGLVFITFQCLLQCTGG